VRGVVLLAVAPMTECTTPGLPPEGLQKFVLSVWQPQVLEIPAGFFNGFKSLTDDATIVFFSDKTVDESAGDDIRLPWDAFGIEVWEEKYR
jgi:dTDP-4-dehydrorhamnose 3,5-epimerase